MRTYVQLVYDLRLNGQDSDRFYIDVGAFAERVVAEIESRGSAAVEGYSRYATQVFREGPCSRGEYALELLTAGMLLRLYGVASAQTPRWVLRLARALYGLRRRSAWVKSAADFLRAGMFQFFMRRPGMKRDAGVVDEEAPTMLSPLPRLIEWLQATGEFEQEWSRLRHWLEYWRGLPVKEAEGQVATALAVFDWFIPEADWALGRYTTGVMPLLDDAYAARFWREDGIFCGRLPVEYHLGMVASEVMNRGLRDEFRRKPRKIVLVPTCMRGSRSETCKAVVHGLDIRCVGCDRDCAVNRITKRMGKLGIDVYMVPHASTFSRWLERWQNDPGVGVAAVACMMNILPGGHEMRARGIASQCVPLDYPGCAKHWMKKAVPTSVNEERLVQIVTSRK